MDLSGKLGYVCTRHCLSAGDQSTKRLSDATELPRQVGWRKDRQRTPARHSWHYHRFFNRHLQPFVFVHHDREIHLSWRTKYPKAQSHDVTTLLRQALCWQGLDRRATGPQVAGEVCACGRQRWEYFLVRQLKPFMSKVPSLESWASLFSYGKREGSTCSQARGSWSGEH